MGDYTVKRFEDIPARKGGGLKLARASLGVTSFGMQIIGLRPNSGDAHPNHDHREDGQEEVYVVLGGDGAIVIDGEEVALEPDMAVRVAPACKRRLRSGGDGLRLLVVGGVPGKPYEAPGFTELTPPEDAAGAS